MKTYGLVDITSRNFGLVVFASFSSLTENDRDLLVVFTIIIINNWSIQLQQKVILHVKCNSFIIGFHMYTNQNKLLYLCENFKLWHFVYELKIS